MFGRTLTTVAFLLVFGAITFASYCVGKYVIAAKVLRPSSNAGHAADATSASSPPVRLAETPSKRRPDIEIAVKPREHPSERLEPSERGDAASPSQSEPPPALFGEESAKTTLQTIPPPQPKPPAVSEPPARVESPPSVNLPKPPHRDAPRRTRPDSSQESTTRRNAPPTAPQPKVQPTPPKPTPAAAPRRSTGGNALHQVQVGAFDSEDNARNLAAELQSKGYHAFMVTEDKDGKVSHKVYAGAFKEKQSAERLKGELEQQGYPVLVR
jgi:cell division septation protein DedD